MRLGKRVVVTNSELGTFRNCRQLWDFGYRQLLRPKRVARPLAVGSAVHSGLAAMYRAIQSAQHNGASVLLKQDQLTAIALEGMRLKLGDHLRGLYELMEQGQDVNIAELVAESETAEREVRGTIERYVATFHTDAARYKVLAVEQSFATPMLADDGRATPRVMYRGVFDLVVLDQDSGDVVLVEHKTSAGDARKAETKLDMDPQTTGYVWTLQQLVRMTGTDRPTWLAGVPRNATVGRVFYNVLRKSGPKEPKWTKDGTLSAAACDTTRAVYEAALRVQETEGGPREDGKPRAPKPRSEKHTELLNALPEDAGKWLKRHETWHSTDEQQRWRREVVAEGGQLRKAIAGKLPVIRNPGHCNMPWSLPCTYRAICRHDSAAAREADFKVVADPHVEIVESEEEQGGAL